MSAVQPIPGLAALPASLTSPRFPPGSRYARTEIAELTRPGALSIAYLRRRFVPAPETLADGGQHVVVAGERLDQIAAATYGDPLQAWQICDANRALDPRELTARPGRRLRLTLPAGMPGAPRA
jgi:nucleoid-associated protein YgaU